jgi:DHA2 family multidrug resistance protein
VSRFDPITRDRLASIAGALVTRGELPALAERHAIAILDGQVTRQAMMLSFERLFLLFGTGFVLATPLLLLMRKGRGFQGGGASH